MPYHPRVCPSNSVSAAGVSTKGTFFGAGYMSSSTNSPWFLTREMYSTWLEALKTLASIGSPGADGGAFEFWISGGGGEGCFSKRPPASPSSRTTANLLAQWKVSLVMVTEEKKTALHERSRRVTWDWCDTQRLSNRCVGSAVGKCALTTADGRILLRSTEHCYTWPGRIVVELGEVWEEWLGGEVSVIMRIFYTGTSGIILRSSLVISLRGTWAFKNSCQNQQSRRFQFNIQTPSSRAITAQPNARTLELMGSTNM